MVFKTAITKQSQFYIAFLLCTAFRLPSRLRSHSALELRYISLFLHMVIGGAGKQITSELDFPVISYFVAAKDKTSSRSGKGIFEDAELLLSVTLALVNHFPEEHRVARF